MDTPTSLDWDDYRQELKSIRQQGSQLDFPNPNQIRTRAASVRRRWSELERLRRAGLVDKGGHGRRAVSVPIIATADIDQAE